MALESFSALFHTIFNYFVNFLHIATISIMNHHSFTGIASKPIGMIYQNYSGYEELDQSDSECKQTEELHNDQQE
jgi:hypothetical protein